VDRPLLRHGAPRAARLRRQDTRPPVHMGTGCRRLPRRRRPRRIAVAAQPGEGPCRDLRLMHEAARTIILQTHAAAPAIAGTKSVSYQAWLFTMLLPMWIGVRVMSRTWAS